jgi:hypothetical protein
MNIPHEEITIELIRNFILILHFVGNNEVVFDETDD